MNRFSQIAIVLFCLLISSCVGEKEGVYFNTGTDYSGHKEIQTLGANYYYQDSSVMSKVIALLGTNYELSEGKFISEYAWKDLVYEKISSDPIHLYLTRNPRIVQDEYGEDMEIESVSLKIMQGEKDFLSVLKFKNRKRVRHFLNDIGQ